MKDAVSLEACLCPVKLPLLCAEKLVVGEGLAVIGGLTLRFDPAKFTARVEEKPLSDGKLEGSWGQPFLWRLTLARTECLKEDEWTLTFEKK